MSNTQPPTYPIPISQVSSDHFYLYDSATISHLRSHHRIPGVLTGTLPQSPQQNLFTGLPLQLMPEEVRLLIEKDLAYIVDDAREHRNGFKAMGAEGRRAWRETLRGMGREVAAGVERDKAQERERALEAMDEFRKEKAKVAIRRKEEEVRAESETPEPSIAEGEDMIFSSSEATRSSTPPTSASPTPPPPTTVTSLQTYAVTPTTSHPPFPVPSQDPSQSLPSTPASYALYKYLHTQPDHTFYISPGLRFGCQYLVYPGDPLRFHSHFLAASWKWEEHLPLLTLVGGGRLGTGVKKGFLIGGEVEEGPETDDTKPPEGDDSATQAERQDEKGDKDVRCFTIEWAGM